MNDLLVSLRNHTLPFFVRGPQQSFPLAAKQTNPCSTIRPSQDEPGGLQPFSHGPSPVVRSPCYYSGTCMILGLTTHIRHSGPCIYSLFYKVTVSIPSATRTSSHITSSYCPCIRVTVYRCPAAILSPPPSARLLAVCPGRADGMASPAARSGGLCPTLLALFVCDGRAAFPKPPLYGHLCWTPAR